MEILRSLEDERLEDYRMGVVAVGNFDGVHLGHQALLRRCYARAVALASPAIILTFEPHPREILPRPDFPKGEPPENFRLTNFAQKCTMFERLNFDAVLALDFNRALAAFSPQEFCEIFFGKDGLAPELVMVGSDFCFGAKRAGTTANLREMGAKLGFALEEIEKISGHDLTYSSTDIRSDIAAGNVVAARQRIGRAWSVQGIVAQGDQRGRTLGFPTANFVPIGVMLPKFGVYAVRVTLENGRKYDGVANYGTRPTVQGMSTRLEAHIFDFEGDIYGQRIEVAFIEFMRPEQKFNGLPELIEQIKLDSMAAQQILAKKE